ncbi:MAG: hypothetical protein ACK4N5_19395 [Myxococcales bacterium]
MRMKFGLMAVVGCALCATVVYAEGTEVAKQDKAQRVVRRDASSLKEAAGKVRSIDKDKNELSILGEGQTDPVKLTVDRTTTIFVDGRIGTLNDVNEGFEVRASYELKQGNNRAQWIEINKRRR